MTHTCQFISGADPARPPLALLHGFGGGEHDLVPLAEELAPGLPILGLRGTVAIDGGHAFFHRFSDRTIDEADITARAPVLADFIRAAIVSHDVTRAPFVIGF
jgi:phospholipase/carboxylesterase